MGSTRGQAEGVEILAIISILVPCFLFSLYMGFEYLRFKSTALTKERDMDRLAAAERQRHALFTSAMEAFVPAATVFFGRMGTTVSADQPSNDSSARGN